MTTSQLGVMLTCLLLASCGNKGDLFLIPDTAVEQELDALDGALLPGDEALPAVELPLGEDGLREIPDDVEGSQSGGRVVAGDR